MQITEVDGEGHDAKALFSGMTLDNRIINIESGEIEKQLLSDKRPPQEGRRVRLV